MESQSVSINSPHLVEENMTEGFEDWVKEEGKSSSLEFIWAVTGLKSLDSIGNNASRIALTEKIYEKWITNEESFLSNKILRIIISQLLPLCLKEEFLEKHFEILKSVSTSLSSTLQIEYRQVERRSKKQSIFVNQSDGMEVVFRRPEESLFKKIEISEFARQLTKRLEEIQQNGNCKEAICCENKESEKPLLPTFNSLLRFCIRNERKSEDDEDKIFLLKSEN